jgi:hypothetical protein
MAFDRAGVDRPELGWVESGSVFPAGAAVLAAQCIVGNCRRNSSIAGAEKP